jgi:hypothetical protein
MQMPDLLLVLLRFEVIVIQLFEMVSLSLPQMTNLLLFCLLQLKMSSIKGSMLSIQLE